MKTTADGLGAEACGTWMLPQLQDPGARIGVFSPGNYAQDLTLGRGPEWNVVGRCFGLRVWRSAASNNQGLWRFGNAALTGWGIISGNSRDTRLFFRPSTASTVLATPTFLGLSSYVFSIQDVAGNARCSVNGGAPFAVAAPAAYVAAGGSALHSWGKWQSENAFPAIGSSILQLYVIDGYDSAGVTSDAAIQYLSGDANQLHRWHTRLEVPTHPRLLMYNSAPDWGGVAGSNFASGGSGGYVFQMTGTGGGKTTMAAYTRYRIPSHARFGNALDRYYERGARIYSIFSTTQFTSSAADTSGGPAGLVIDMYGKNLGIVGNADAGVSVNGTNLAGNNIAAELDTFDAMRSVDVPGIVAGAAKPFVLTEGLQSIELASGEIKPNASPQFIRLPTGSTLVWGDAYGAFSDVDVYDHDSLLCEIVGMTGVAGVKGPPYDAAIPLQRAALGPRRVVSKGLGGQTWHNLISTAAKRAQYLSELQALARGSVSNRFRVQLGTNDYGFNTYLLLTDLTTDLVTMWGSVLALGLPGTKIQLIGTTDRTGGGTPNPSGWTLANFRTAIQNAVTTLADARVTYLDAAAAVSGANKPDGLHYNTAGQAEYSAFLTANPPP